MDGLDAMLAEAAVERARKEQTPTKKPAPKPIAAPAAPVAQPATSDPGTARAAEALKAYLQRLLDPDALERIAAELGKRSFDEVVRYAFAHPELATYTLEQELPRMDYAVHPPDGGAPLRAKAAIRSLFEAGAAATADDAGLAWRLANQSLLADLLLPLQGWMDVELSISVRAASCRFELDLRAGRVAVRAHAALSILTLGAGDAPLELATSEASVSVSLSERRVEQSVAKPRLCRCVVFEEQLLGVADAIARSGGLGGPGAGAGADAGGGAGGVARGAAAGGDGAQSLEDVTRELERFMVADEGGGEGDQTTGCRNQ